VPDTEHRDIPLHELLTEQPESTDPDYLEWKRKKIEATIEADARHPERRLDIDDVFDRLYRDLDSRESRIFGRG
jgi:hypothetical protein